MQGPRTRPRRPVNPYEVLFAVGGWCRLGLSFFRACVEFIVCVIRNLNFKTTSFQNLHILVATLFKQLSGTIRLEKNGVLSLQ